MYKRQLLHLYDVIRSLVLQIRLVKHRRSYTRNGTVATILLLVIQYQPLYSTISNNAQTFGEILATSQPLGNVEAAIARIIFYESFRNMERKRRPLVI